MALINDFMSLIYPRHCEACGNTLFSHENLLCNYCRVNLPRSEFHLHPVNELRRLFDGRVPLQEASAYYLYEKSGRVQQLVHAIKYQQQQQLAEWIGGCYAEELFDSGAFTSVDVIVPIPLHKNKLKLRGYNQSLCFAKGLGTVWQKSILPEALERSRATATQTRKKKYQRWENVEGIFTLPSPSNLAHKHVLLVDDVITTGATIEAAWMALQQVEGIRLSVLSLAFAARAFA